MAPVEILIVGCGIAGPTLASFLLLAGDDVPAAQLPRITILERSPTVRAHLRGQNIDVRGAGATVLRKLGLLGAVRAAGTGEAGVRLVDARDRVWSERPVDRTGRVQTGTADLEILRSALARLCYEGSRRAAADAERRGAPPGPVEYIFGDRVDELVQDGDKVRVRLAGSGQRRAFDLVVGADGVQSPTRRMVWGEGSEADRVRRLGMFAGFFSMPCEATDSEWRRWYHAPGRRGVMLRPDGTGARTTVFMSVINEKDPRLVEAGTNGDVESQKALLEEYFHDAGWECDRVIREMKTTDDFYYDMLAQVKMSSWSKGRVVLLGDAGYCASPVSGLGTTLALTGAYNLAGCLQNYIRGDDPDPSAALAEYEKKMRPTVDAAQNLPPGLPHLIHPETAWGVWVMRFLINMLSRTRFILVAVQFMGKFFKRGTQTANYVPVEDYGFREMPELVDDES